MALSHFVGLSLKFRILLLSQVFPGTVEELSQVVLVSRHELHNSAAVVSSNLDFEALVVLVKLRAPWRRLPPSQLAVDMTASTAGEAKLPHAVEAVILVKGAEAHLDHVG